jgi:hypothetical protein
VAAWDSDGYGVSHNLGIDVSNFTPSDPSALTVINVARAIWNITALASMPVPSDRFSGKTPLAPTMASRQAEQSNIHNQAARVYANSRQEM